MRKKLNDIRIRALHKKGETDNSFSVLRNINNKNYLTSEDSKSNLKELMNSNRRNFLRVVLASGGVLLTGGFISKINKLNNIPLVSQSMKTNGPFSLPVDGEFIRADGLGSDYDSFFKNFSIVKNKKEYVLYDKNGESILMIDRDS